MIPDDGRSLAHRPVLPLACPRAPAGVARPGTYPGTCTRCDEHVMVDPAVAAMLSRAGVVSVLVCSQCWTIDDYNFMLSYRELRTTSRRRIRWTDDRLGK